MRRTWSRREWTCFALATLVYFVASLLVLRHVLPNPTHLLPYNSGIDPGFRWLGHMDQSMVVSVLVRNAHLLLTEPWSLLGDGQCFPFPQSFTLGEHMFGEGLLIAIPWALTSDPILAYNLMLVLTLWIPGVTMYLLTYNFVRHGGAAFVAGLFLLLAPPRIIDGGHPYLHAEFWLPLILLFLHQLFTGNRRWLPAAGLGLFLALEALETIYVLLAVALVTAVYGLFLAARFPRRIPSVALPLATSLAFSIGVACVVLLPYFDTRASWDVLSGRPTALFRMGAYGPGSPYFVGGLGLVLALAGLLDRFVHKRAVRGDDPRAAMLAAALTVVWASATEIPIPGTDWALPGLLALLSQIVPGLDAVRALFAVVIGLWVPVALLAGYGMLVITDRLPRRAGIALVALLTLAIGAERLVPEFARWNFGSALDLFAWEARPPEEDIELVRAVNHGPVFDVPVASLENPLSRASQARHLLLQSWNPKPSSSCYNSFDTPLAEQLTQIGNALPNVGAVESLAAIGFGQILSHDLAWWPPHRARWKRRVAADPEVVAVMPEVARSSGLSAYALTARTPVHEDLERLGGLGEGPAVELEPAPEGRGLVVPFVFSNPGPGTFRSPGPLRPRPAKLRWQNDADAIAGTEEVRVLWPVALGRNEMMRVDVIASRPPRPGIYRVELLDPAAGERVAASRAVIVPEAAPDREEARAP